MYITAAAAMMITLTVMARRSIQVGVAVAGKRQPAVAEGVTSGKVTPPTCQGSAAPVD